MIPKRFHFVFGLKPQSEPFHLVYYLCLKSCMEVNQLDSVTLYYHFEPHGPWWERIKPSVDLKKIELEKFVTDHEAYGGHKEGRFIQKKNLTYAHQADFARLRFLKEHGGVYADMDTIFVNPLPEDFYRQPFVIAEEDPIFIEGQGMVPGLCNAFMMAEAGSEFAGIWLERMYKVFDGTWSRHSCQEADRLRRERPELLRVVAKRHFFKHMWTREGIHTLLEGRDDDFREVYSMHLWNHLWWEESRKDFSDFHAGLLTEDYIWNRDTTYNIVARRFLEKPGS